jgi:Na+/proline symporter
MSIAKDADKLFPYFIAHYLPPGLSGLIVTAFLAAAMSSLDSGVNAITAVVSKDFLERFNRFPSDEKSKVRLMRWITFGIGVMVVVLGLLVKHVPGNVYEVTNKTSNLVSVPIFGLFIMAWYMPFVTPLGALIGTLCSVIVAVLVGFWDVITGRNAFSFQYIGLSAIIVGLAVGALLSRFGPRREDVRGTRHDPAASWNSGGCICGRRGMNSSKPGGSWSRGWLRSSPPFRLPDFMNTTLGFTASATEAKASLRLWRLPAAGAAAVVSAA